jgi:hypothetical protein
MTWATFPDKYFEIYLSLCTDQLKAMLIIQMDGVEGVSQSENIEVRQMSECRYGPQVWSLGLDIEGNDVKLCL